MRNATVMEFHISHKARDLYRFDESFFTVSGNAIFPNFRAVRLFVQKMNEKNPRVMKQALDWLYQKFGRYRLDETLQKFLVEFPAVVVYRGEIPPEIYLEGETEGVPNRQIILEEMLMLWMANRNPAFSPFTELFDEIQAAEEEGEVPAR